MRVIGLTIYVIRASEASNIQALFEILSMFKSKKVLKIVNIFFFILIKLA